MNAPRVAQSPDPTGFRRAEIYASVALFRTEAENFPAARASLPDEFASRLIESGIDGLTAPEIRSCLSVDRAARTPPLPGLPAPVETTSLREKELATSRPELSPKEIACRVSCEWAVIRAQTLADLLGEARS